MEKNSAFPYCAYNNEGFFGASIGEISKQSIAGYGTAEYQASVDASITRHLQT
jgi:hypothetical protein